MVIKRIEQFISNKKKLYETLADISSSSAHSISRLNKELEAIKKQLKKIEQLQGKYMTFSHLTKYHQSF
ncbi:hypothetical protein [Gracilibacillus saliphilus]|uniref:hypothetical protein n=1 Tax=Gracilibacillus saliphilus TaxID=543890 RepID=UPI001EE37F68|nr:hypothetical protein [Gracilibacillus saliphilus]